MTPEGTSAPGKARSVVGASSGIELTEGALDGTGLRMAIVAARFNETVVERLLAGAIDGLVRHGVAAGDLHVARVPGAFEVPLAARVMAQEGTFDAVVCVGALVRGATPHFNLLASQVCSALGQVQLETGVPVAFAVLTCNSVEQAMDRAGLKGGNKGFEAAMVAIEMANLLRQLRRERPRGRRRDRT